MLFSYPPPKPQEQPSFNLDDFDTIFQALLDEKGHITAVFLKHGHKMPYVKIVHRIAMVIEKTAIELIKKTPTLSEQEWYTRVYTALQHNHLPKKTSDVLTALTPEQCTAVCQQVILFNPEYDKTRTFRNFVEAIQEIEEN